MTKRHTLEDMIAKSPFNLMSPELAMQGKERFEELVGLQATLLDDAQKTGQEWMDRLQSEIHLNTQLACQFASARSVPDVMATCREWSSRWFEMAAEDVKHAVADAQKFMERGAHFLSNGRGHHSTTHSGN